MDFRSLRDDVLRGLGEPEYTDATVSNWINDVFWDLYYKSRYGLTVAEVREQLAAETQAFLASR